MCDACYELSRYSAPTIQRRGVKDTNYCFILYPERRSVWTASDKSAKFWPRNKKVPITEPDPATDEANGRRSKRLRSSLIKTNESEPEAEDPSNLGNGNTVTAQQRDKREQEPNAQATETKKKRLSSPADHQATADLILRKMKQLPVGYQADLFPKILTVVSATSHGRIGIAKAFLNATGKKMDR